MENPQISVPTLLTRLEVCKQLRCSATTLSRLGIPQVKIRRRVWYRRETIEAWILAQETRSGCGTENEGCKNVNSGGLYESK